MYGHFRNMSNIHHSKYHGTEQEQIGYVAPIRREFNPRSKLMVAQNFGKRSDDEGKHNNMLMLNAFKSKIVLRA